MKIRFISDRIRNIRVFIAIEDGCNIIPPVNDLNVAGPSFKSKCLVASTPAANYYVKNSSLHTGMYIISSKCWLFYRLHARVNNGTTLLLQETYLTTLTVACPVIFLHRYLHVVLLKGIILLYLEYIIKV